MTRPPALAPHHRRSDAALSLTVLIALLLSMLAGATTAVAADESDALVTITDGSVAWRITDNVRLQGSWNQIQEVEGGVVRETCCPEMFAGAQADLDAFRFPIGAGATFDPDSGLAMLPLDGAVTIGNENRGNYTLRFTDLQLTVDDGVASLRGTISGETAPGEFGGVPTDGGPFGPTTITTIASWDVNVTFEDEQLTIGDVQSRTSIGPDGAARGFTTSFIDALPPALQSWWQVTDDDPASAGSQRKLLSPISVTIGELALPPEPTPTSTTGSAVLSVDSVAPGGSVTISGDGFLAEEELIVELRSDPVQLGTTTADGNGAASTTVTIPSDTPPGPHTLALVGSDHVVTATLLVLGVDGAGEVTDGYLDWGVRASFRNYILGPIANGDIETSAGLTTNDDGTFRFGDASGTVDVEERDIDVTFVGQVRFLGHSGIGPDGGSGLDLTISSPRLVITGDTGSLFVDAESLPLGGSEVAEFDQVLFATLDLAGIDFVVNPGTLTLSDVPTTLTEQGEAAFGGFYDAGEPLDPLSLVLALDGAALEVDAPTDTTPEAPEAVVVPSAAAAAPTLPDTGSENVALILLAIALLGVGGALLGRTRLTAR